MLLEVMPSWFMFTRPLPFWLDTFFTLGFVTRHHINIRSSSTQNRLSVFITDHGLHCWTTDTLGFFKPNKRDVVVFLFGSCGRIDGIPHRINTAQSPRRHESIIQSCMRVLNVTAEPDQSPNTMSCLVCRLAVEANQRLTCRPGSLSAPNE